MNISTRRFFGLGPARQMCRTPAQGAGPEADAGRVSGGR